MTRHPTAPLLLSVLLPTLALTGCTKMTNTDKLDPAKDAASYAQAFVDLAGQWRARCFGESQGATDAWYQYFMFQVNEPVRASQAGRRGYDKALATSCLEAIAALQCGASPPPNCYDPVLAMPPAVPVNGACTDTGECKAPAVTCSFGGNAPACPGKCLAPGGAGAPCYGPTDLAGCATGFWCSGSTAVSAGTCTANAGVGADCSVASCATNLFCRYNTATAPPTYVCDFPVSPGSACGSNGYACVSSAYCDYSANVCRSYVSAGNSCAAGLQCESGLYCDPATVRCKAYPTAPSPVGGSCAAPAFCDQTVAWCDSTTTCRAYVPAGGACNGYDQCGFASFCRGYTGGATSGTCARLGDVGSSCRTGASECLGGLYCDAPAGSAIATPGKCKAMSGIGGTCGQVNTGEYADCLSGQCDYGSPPAPTGTCVGYVGPGGNCSRLSCDPFQYLVCTAGTCAPTTYCHP